MATTATRTTVVTFSGDVQATQQANAAVNLSSPGEIQVLNLPNNGANTITVPKSSDGTTVFPTAVTIQPLVGGSSIITLKGVTGDTGIALHLTDPTTIGLASSVVSFVLTTNAANILIRFTWS